MHQVEQTLITVILAGALQKWRRERGAVPGSSSSTDGSAARPSNGPVCERVVVFSKRDLVPDWGIKVRKVRLCPSGCSNLPELP